MLPPCWSVDAVVEQFATYQCADITTCFDENERMDGLFGWTV